MVTVSFLIGLSLLLWRIEADPPLISWSIDAFGDPGHYLHNARSLAKFGYFDRAIGHAPYVAPGFFLLNWAGFLAFGSSLVTARLLDAMAWALSGGAIYYARRRDSVGDDLLSALVFLSLTLLAGARAPKGDLWSIAVFSWGLALIRNESPRATAGAAFLLGCAPFFKLHTGAPAGGAIVASGIVLAFLSQRRFRAFLAGLAGAAGVWIAYAIFLHQMGALYSGIETGAKVLGSVGIVTDAPVPAARWNPFRLLSSNFWIREPFLGLFGCIGLAAIVATGGRNILRKPDHAALIGACFFSAATLSLTPYDPLRYRIVWVPILAFAATALPAGRTATMIGSTIFSFAVGGWLGLRLQWGPWIPAVCTAVLGGAICRRVAPVLTPQRFRLLLVIACLIQASQAIWFFSQCRYEIRDAAMRMNSILPANAILTGYWSLNLALFTHHRIGTAPSESAAGPATHLVEEDAFLAPYESPKLLGEARLPTIHRRIGFYSIEHISRDSTSSTHPQNQRLKSSSPNLVPPP